MGNKPIAKEIDGDESVSYNYAEDLKKSDLDKGYIYVFNEIMDASANLFNMEMNRILRNSLLKTIVIDVNSPGGEVYSAFNMYNVIKSAQALGRKVIISVNGLAASAASMIVLQAGTYRTAYKNSRILLHEPRKMFFMTSQSGSHMRDEVKAMDSICDTIYDMLAERSSKTKEEWSKIIERKEVWLTADEALEYGLIDKVIE